LALETDTLRECVAALKHDLGKYVAWTSANLDEEAWHGPVGDVLAEALAGDVLATHRNAGRVEAAWEVWERLTRDLPRPLPAPELERVERAVDQLRAAAPALRERDPGALAGVRGQVRAAQQTIRRELADLHRRLGPG
jgi:hypothetical protein